MANITILEALNRSLIATKKYVDDKVAEADASGGYTHEFVFTYINSTIGWLGGCVVYG